MGRIITTKDGTNHTVMDRRDLEDLIEATAGSEVRMELDSVFRDMEEEQQYETAMLVEKIRFECEETVNSLLEKIRKIAEAYKDLDYEVWKDELDPEALKRACFDMEQILKDDL